MISAARLLDHPRSTSEEGIINRFRTQYVDLSPEDTKMGRWLRDQIIKEIELQSDQPQFLVILKNQSFGAGSFGRSTICNPLDDIDIYVVLSAGGAWVSDDGDWFELAGSRRGCFNTDPNLRSGDWISADRVLHRFASRLGDLPIVRKYLSSFGVNNKRKSAFVKFGDLNVDITPVLWSRFRNGIDRFYMPQGGGSQSWKATNPKEDQRRLGKQNVAQRSIVIPTIRLMKWWNEKFNKNRLKGIHLEVMVEKALGGYRIEGIAQALHLAFASIPSQLEYMCPDPTMLGPDLDVNLSASDRRTSTNLAHNAHLATIDAAQFFRSGNAIVGLHAWRRIFPGM